jgi:hypothetical protein
MGAHDQTHTPSLCALRTEQHRRVLRVRGQGDIRQISGGSHMLLEPSSTNAHQSSSTSPHPHPHAFKRPAKPQAHLNRDWMRTAALYAALLLSWPAAITLCNSGLTVLLPLLPLLPAAGAAAAAAGAGAAPLLLLGSDPGSCCCCCWSCCCL